MNIENLLDSISSYDSNNLDKIKKAYEYADLMHQGQYRQSGEPYITHPLNVAYILSELHADSDTLCAALLHDTLEDTKATKEEIIENFNEDVATLVDGVTNLSNIDFSSVEEKNIANTRKILTSMMIDVRIIIIKLADRLHNMRTIEYKSIQKQREKAIETLEIFAPLAYYIGAYHLKNELEDLSFKVLMPEAYKEILGDKLALEENNKDCIKEMLDTLKSELDKEHLYNEIRTRTKNIYGIYQSIEKGNTLLDIHDLMAIKIMLNSNIECYQGLGIVHKLYKPVNEMFKDYICNPKPNLYSSLHTTVFAPNDHLVQVQLRTFDMEKIDSKGIMAYWFLKSGDARETMQKKLTNKIQFYQSLSDINSMFTDNNEFISNVKTELFAPKIYVYDTKGEVIELPLGSTILDFAFSPKINQGNNIVGAYINDNLVHLDTKLSNGDRVRIIVNTFHNTPSYEWLDKVNTSYARKRIKDSLK